MSNICFDFSILGCSTDLFLIVVEHSNFVITESADDMQRTLETTNLKCHDMPISKQSPFTVIFINMLHVHENQSSIGTL